MLFLVYFQKRINELDNENRTVLIQDPIQLVTLSYDEDMFSDLNKTYVNENYYSENENDPFHETLNDVIDLKNNLTSNDTSEEDAEFEEVDSEEEEDDNNLLTTNSTLVESKIEFNSTIQNLIFRSINQTLASNSTEDSIQLANLINQQDLNEQDQLHLTRSKRQCRHNRRLNNRRWNTRRERSNRSNRSNRRAHPQYNHFKESPPLEEGKKWELLEKSTKRNG